MLNLSIEELEVAAGFAVLIALLLGISLGMLITQFQQEATMRAYLEDCRIRREKQLTERAAPGAVTIRKRGVL